MEQFTVHQVVANGFVATEKPVQVGRVWGAVRKNRIQTDVSTRTLMPPIAGQRRPAHAVAGHRAIGPGTFTTLPGGGFRWAGLHGLRRFDCCQGFDGWYLKSAMVNGEDVTDRPFDTGSGGGRYQGDLVVATRGAAVSGTVTTDEGVPGTFTVVVFPLDRGGWGPGSRYVKVVQTDRSGAFRVSGLPPGDYLVSALETPNRTGAPEWPAPDVLAAVAGRAEPLVLAEGEHATAALRVPGR